MKTPTIPSLVGLCMETFYPVLNQEKSKYRSSQIERLSYLILAKALTRHSLLTLELKFISDFTLVAYFTNAILVVPGEILKWFMSFLTKSNDLWKLCLPTLEELSMMNNKSKGCGVPWNEIKVTCCLWIYILELFGYLNSLERFPCCRVLESRGKERSDFVKG